jgi:hypothetical protein
MKSVIVVQHLHRLPSGADDVKLIGVYRTEANARAAVGRLAMQPGFCKHANVIDPELDQDDQGFHIDEYELDKDHWTEGYVTMVGDEEYEEP